MVLDVIRYVGGPLLAAVIGGLIVHFATRRRDAENERRRQRIDYLVRAYRTLAHSAHRELTSERAEAFEDALSDVVLFGNADQIKLAREIIEALASGGAAPVDRLLVSFRSALRGELDLSRDGLDRVPVVRFHARDDLHTPVQVGESWQVRINRTQASVATAVSASSHPPSNVDLGEGIAELRNMATTAPGAAVVAAYGHVIDALTALLGESSHDGRDALELAHAAALQGLVTNQLVETVQGLAVLRNLSRREDAGTGLSVEKAIDYIELVTAALYVIHTSRPGGPAATLNNAAAGDPLPPPPADP
ncbi:hypothetical protein RB614_15825 [Phytohabitans sp. ZYX-F-186]|uniref:Nitrate/nitrite sensing protein domain-containing protein n=1 Tax=Phytohabitans maris TaxID=3071409 RepID=A0ABU0ZFZ6_9ACTN|nr:hypothetical protein [Phytohabitans sp. ZYX-F-186]MDQ7905981.1 hypothetical protein [Phytohabitans sp. ZYX-F-186]